MPTRVAYWTSAFYPEMEAIAGEVALLRREFPASVAWGISPNCRLQMSWRRGFGFHPRLHWLFRGVTSVLQRGYDVNHIFGSLGDWFHLKAASKKPTILTAAAVSAPCDARLLERVDKFVVEWPQGRDPLIQHGIPAEDIRLILPPVDTDRFRPQPAPDCAFTVLFASSPERSDWLTGRGVHLLLDAAALRPEYRFRLLWRPWGNSYETVTAEIARRELTNVEIRRGRFDDMSEQYYQVHTVVAPFVDITQCKPSPNSLIEGLACGRPVVATDVVGLADVFEEDQVGVVCEREAPSLASALDRVKSEWPRLAANAATTARKRFSIEHFVKSYTQLYAELV